MALKQRVEALERRAAQAPEEVHYSCTHVTGWPPPDDVPCPQCAQNAREGRTPRVRHAGVVHAPFPGILPPEHEGRDDNA